MFGVLSGRIVLPLSRAAVACGELFLSNGVAGASVRASRKQRTAACPTNMLAASAVPVEFWSCPCAPAFHAPPPGGQMSGASGSKSARGRRLDDPAIP